MGDNENHEIKYCVTAVIDLLGFANHLEIGRNDLRTNIGREALNRLQILERALQLIEAERAFSAHEYPKSFFHTRINDAIILSLDLPTFLTPPVGKFERGGFSPGELLEHFDFRALETSEQFKEAYDERLSQDTSDLNKFVGLVSRVHTFINGREHSSFFPGAKTIIATGYRRPFFSGKQEDFLSANFSFSNAYEADKHLHGPNLYLDNNIAQLLSTNPFARNLLRFACYVLRFERFDPFGDYVDVLSTPGQRVKLEPIEMSLFRIPFSFRELDPAPLRYLQVINRLSRYLEGKVKPKATDDTWLEILNEIKIGPTPDAKSGKPIRWLGTSLKHDMSLFSLIIEKGESALSKLMAKNQKKRLVKEAVKGPKSGGVKSQI